MTARKVNYAYIAHVVREEGKLTLGEIATRWNLSPSVAYAVLRIIPQAYPDIIRINDTLMTTKVYEREMEKEAKSEK
jgi:hypothetical protein